MPLQKPSLPARGETCGAQKPRLPRDQNVFCRTPGKVRLKSDTAGALIQHPPLEEKPFEAQGKREWLCH